MDGDFSPHALIEEDRIRPGIGARMPNQLQSVPTSSRLSLFLQRDFSDDALRQPMEPLFGQAELESRRQEGFDAGYAAGLADAAASQAAHQAATERQCLGVVTAAIVDGSRQAATVADQSAACLAKTLLESLRAVMPTLIERSAVAEVDAMLARVLPGLSREPAVRVEVPSSLADYFVRKFKELAPEQGERINVIGIAAMTPGEARVCWASGHARRQPARVWESVMEALLPSLDESAAKDLGNAN